MKKIFVSMLAGLFLFAGTGLKAQPKGNGNGNGPRQEMRNYMMNTIKPELMKEKQIWMKALNKKETVELLKIKEEQEAIRTSMRGKVTPENREQTRKAHFSAFKPRLDKIVNAHPDLKKQYVQVMTQNKEQWTKDLEAIGEKSGKPHNGMGPEKMMERMTDPAFILMWNPQRDYSKMAMRHSKMKKGQKAGMKKGGMKAGYKKAMEPGIHIFPQPASATVMVKITGVKDKKVEANVYDSKGKNVAKLYHGASSMPVLSNTLNVSGWENGIYLVKVSFGDRSMSMDFKVEK